MIEVYFTGAEYIPNLVQIQMSAMLYTINIQGEAVPALACTLRYSVSRSLLNIMIFLFGLCM